ncbi:MAG: ACP S-malonyltransferase [Helicobacteraceae bacterium]|jgi:[acyl-carrier-protein] S-malonyltransferase|nr:ACP S-malonyltransferase [Helicobacteraceae bacterium]
MKRVAFIFPGQGSQQIGMGKSFIDRYDAARELLEEANDALGYDLRELLFYENDRLSQTRYTQSAILFVSLMAHKLFENELPIKPLYALGHSLGELSAVGAMGGLTFADALKTADRRGELMQKACEGKNASMMVVLGIADRAAEEVCAEARENGREVYPANYNSDGQIVIAGIKDDLALSEEMFKKAGAKRTLLLDMSVASHCPLQAQAAEPFREWLEAHLNGPLIAPVVSNAEAKPYRAKEDAIAQLQNQLVKPVLYKQCIRAIEGEVDLFIEFGNSQVLKGLNKKITAKPTISVSNAEDLEGLIAELGGEE